MKPAHKTRQASWLKPAVLFACSAFATLLVTACGGGGGGGSSVPLPPYSGYNAYGAGLYPTCAGCPGQGGQGYLVSAIADAGGAYGGVAELGLDFYGASSVLGQQPGYPVGGYPQQGYFMAQPQGAYYGPFFATGYFAVTQPLSECGIMPGNYMLQTQQPGVFGADGAGRSFDNILFVGSGGPIPIQILASGFTMPAMPAATGILTGRPYPYRMTVTTFQIKRMDTMVTCSFPSIMQ